MQGVLRGSLWVSSNYVLSNVSQRVVGVWPFCKVDLDRVAQHDSIPR